jgi:hypothetical protein
MAFDMAKMKIVLSGVKAEHAGTYKVKVKLENQ